MSVQQSAGLGFLSGVVWIVHQARATSTFWRIFDGGGRMVFFNSLTLFFSTQILEYLEDLDYYYKYGYGTDLNSKVGCPIARELMGHLKYIFIFLYYRNWHDCSSRLTIGLFFFPRPTTGLRQKTIPKDRQPCSGSVLPPDCWPRCCLWTSWKTRSLWPTPVTTASIAVSGECHKWIRSPVIWLPCFTSKSMSAIRAWNFDYFRY